MKQSAAKTLGVAALGAAFAATAAGSASAAGSIPDTTSVLDGVTRTLPLDQVAAQLPPGASDSVTTGRDALGTVGQSAPVALGALKAANPLSGLLGGLPINGLAQGGLPINGIPLGG